MNNEPVAWIGETLMGRQYINGQKGILPVGTPLYTHPAKELNAGGEPVKNATYWKKQHDGLLMKLNMSAIKIAELEKDLALKTRDRDVFRNFTLAYEERIADLERCAEYYRDKYYFDSPAKTLTDEEYKPLTEADVPYQKVAPKEVAEAIDKALGLKTNMNNEPVAWGMTWVDGEIYDVISPKQHEILEGDYTIPLYTHPAKTLTDEEIYEIAMEVQTGFLPQDDTLAFARAILKKANEK